MKIFCVGRNYSEHAKELGNNVPENPVIFLKPDTAILKNNLPFFMPDFSQNIQHEVELVIRINKLGKKIEARFAKNYYSEIGLGIDFTARDLQNDLKSKGLPWELAKAFDNSAPLGDFVSLNKLSNPINFSLKKNGETVQQGNSSEMIFGFDKIISFISQYFTLKIGDLIYTGTPAGVSEVKIGDKLEGYIEDQLMLNCNVK